jgi:thiamine-monophosphate kinase
MADAGHVARASRVRLVVHEALLRPALAGALLTVAQELGLDPLELALYGGEDYALLGTGPRRRRPTGARVIGQVEAGAGVWLQRLDGNRSLANPGFDHLTSG